jgi:hypothetical protein
MAHKHEEMVVVRVPKGNREALHKITDSRYTALSSVARVAIMKEIDLDRRKAPKAAA